MSRRFDSVHWILATASAILLGGCATNPGLAKFGGAATALADSYRPILSAPSRLCGDNLVLKLIGSESTFDVRTLKDDAGLKECANISEQQATRMVVADAISAYGEQLSLLAGAEPVALTADIEGVATAAKGIKDRKGDPAFDETKIDALTKVATILVEWSRAREARRTAKELMARSEPSLKSLVQEMTIWTQGTVIPRIDESIKSRQFLLADLVRQSASSDKQSVAQTYPFRLAQSTVQKEISALEQEKKTALAFIPAAEAFVESHKSLGAAYDDAGKEAQLEAVRGFIDKLRALRKAAQAL